MTTRSATTSAFVLALVATVSAPGCNPAKQDKQPFVAAAPDTNQLAPREVTEGVWNHSPFEVGACETCHANADPTNPGPVAAKGRAMCNECHHEFIEHLAEHQVQHKATDDCTACHNPHNADNKKFVHSTGDDLCLQCHAEIATKTHPQDGSAAGNACRSCHTPHAANGKGLLKEDS